MEQDWIILNRFFYFVCKQGQNVWKFKHFCINKNCTDFLKLRFKAKLFYWIALDYKGLPN